MRIYLAGGLKGNWQSTVQKSLPNEDFADPRTHGLQEEMDYTVWDCAHVDACDVVFVCITADNPSGYGAMVELGRGSGLGKYIIFVDERSPVDARFSRYMGMARSMANYSTDNLEDGIKKLRWLAAHPALLGYPSKFECALAEFHGVARY